MGEFIEKITHSRGFELCGRIIRERDDLVVFIDDVGRFVIPSGMVMATILGLGESSVSGPVAGIARVSESGKGFYLEIGGAVYVTPVSRVRAVLSGEHRKGPVSRVRERCSGSS